MLPSIHSPNLSTHPPIHLFIYTLNLQSTHSFIFQSQFDHSCIHPSIHSSSHPLHWPILPSNCPPILSTPSQLATPPQNLSSTLQALSPASLIHCSPPGPDSQVGLCCLGFVPLSWMSSRLATTPASLSASRPSRSCTPSSKLCLSLSRWVEGTAPMGKSLMLGKSSGDLSPHVPTPQP